MKLSKSKSVKDFFSFRKMTASESDTIPNIHYHFPGLSGKVNDLTWTNHSLPLHRLQFTGYFQNGKNRSAFAMNSFTVYSVIGFEF